jgi:hypothetical protein
LAHPSVVVDHDVSSCASAQARPDVSDAHTGFPSGTTPFSGGHFLFAIVDVQDKLLLTASNARGSPDEKKGKPPALQAPAHAVENCVVSDSGRRK